MSKEKRSKQNDQKANQKAGRYLAKPARWAKLFDTLKHTLWFVK